MAAYSMTGEDDVLIPLGQHPLATLNTLGRVHNECVVRVSPFCHEHPDNQREVRGWVLDVPSHAEGSTLPISFNLFDGVTVVKCEMEETDIFKIMQNMDEMRAKLGRAVDKVMSVVEATDQKERATWARCRPSMFGGFPPTLEKATKDKEGVLSFVRDEESSGCSPIIDSESWIPELSPNGFIGLYHHWHRSSRDNRLCMYIVCQAYLPKACLEFADLVHQVGESCTAGSICLSEEAQWLKTACSRNRCRLILQVCEEMGLHVPSMLDYNACNPKTRMAIPTSETLHHDMIPKGKSMVRILNYCSETQRASNGSVCAMAPWDGVWIFHGCRMILQRESSRGCDFGFPYGCDHHLLPTCSPQVKDRASYAHTPLTFSAADPAQCKALQIWNVGNTERLVLVQHSALQPNTTTSSSYYQEEEEVEPPPPKAIMMVGDIGGGLDPDVVQAYQQILLDRACPQSVLIPNIPGALPSSKTINHLVFDEHILDAMSKKGWDRTQGITMLTPMACVLYEHWKNKGATAYDVA